MDRVDQQVASKRRGLADEPLGGEDALARHSLGQSVVPSAGGSVAGAVGEAAAAATAADAAKSAAAAAIGISQQGGSDGGS